MDIKEVVLTKEEYDKGMKKINDYDTLSKQLNLFIDLLYKNGIDVSNNSRCSFDDFNGLIVNNNMGGIDGTYIKIILTKD